MGLVPEFQKQGNETKQYVHRRVRKPEWNFLVNYTRECAGEIQVAVSAGGAAEDVKNMKQHENNYKP